MIIKNNKKIIFIVCSIFLSFSFVLTILLSLYAQNTDKYTFYTKNISSNLFINEIRISDSIVILNDYQYETNKYDSKLGLIKLSSNQNYVLKKSMIDNLKISFENKSNETKKLIIKKNNKVLKTIDIKAKTNYVFMDNISVSSIIRVIFNNIGLWIILLIIMACILSLIYYFLLLYIYRFICELLNNRLKVIKYIITMLIMFFLTISYIFILMQVNKYIVLIPTIIILIRLGVIFFKKLQTNLENMYLILSLFIGIIFIFIFPPLHVPDEFSHFVKTYQTSYIFEDTNEIKKDAIYVYLPQNLNNFLTKYGSQTLNYDYVIQPKTYFSDIIKFTNYCKLSKTPTWYSLKYSSAISYLPGTIISIIARISKMPIILLNYFSKLFTFVISTLMCYYAIKIAPKFKKIFFVVPLLPIFIQQSFGFNVDWLTNSTFALILASILKWMFDSKNFGRRDLIILVFLSIILGFCKFGYFPIAILLFLIKTNNNNKLEKHIKLSIGIILVLLPIAVLFINRLSSSNLQSSISRDIIPISMLWSNPKMIISILIETFKIRLDLDLFRGLITGFGWSTIWSNSLFVFVSLVVLICLLFCDDKDNAKLTKKQKLLFFISFVSICAIIYGAMLFGWTEMGSMSIDGLQPRYFIPAVMLLYILLQNGIIYINIKNKKLMYYSSMAFINILALLTIIEKIYV